MLWRSLQQLNVPLRTCRTAYALIQRCRVSFSSVCKNHAASQNSWVKALVSLAPESQILKIIVSASVSQNLICEGIPQPSRSKEIIRVVIISTAITFPVIFLRMTSRYIVAGIWWDDWVVVVAAVSSDPRTESS